MYHHRLEKGSRKEGFGKEVEVDSWCRRIQVNGFMMPRKEGKWRKGRSKEWIEGESISLLFLLVERQEDKERERGLAYFFFFHPRS